MSIWDITWVILSGGKKNLKITAECGKGGSTFRNNYDLFLCECDFLTKITFFLIFWQNLHFWWSLDYISSFDEIQSYLAILRQIRMLFCPLLTKFVFLFLQSFNKLCDCFFSFDEMCGYFTIFWWNLWLFCDLLAKFEIVSWTFDKICCSFTILWQKLAVFSWSCIEIHLFPVTHWQNLWYFSV